MNEAAQCLYTWWDVMADMNAKYGTPPDIETKPEWPSLQDAQTKLIQELMRVTGSPETFLFEAVQDAMFQVLGVKDEEVTLSEEEASEIVDLIVKKAAVAECQGIRAKGMLN